MSSRRAGTLNRRQFLRAAAGVTLAGVAKVGAAPPRPNVLYIMADDLGYADLSSYGRPDFRTPALDLLARQGVRFTNAYANANYCTPTRCAFMTGRYQQRIGGALERPLSSQDENEGLPPGNPTLASLLRSNGYETALIGKWHLGFKPEYGPNRHGFEQFFGILSGAVDYFSHMRRDGKLDLHENLNPVERKGYLTDLLTARAAEFIMRRRNRPFYLSLHYNAPHWPWQGPADVTTSPTPSAEFTQGGSLKIFAAMVRRMDEGIGGVMKALRDAGLGRNTLVIFTSDNGGERYSFNWPFSGHKGELREGGIRVPAILRWPGVVPAGTSTDQAAISMDWHATILSATQTRPDPAYPPEGENLLPVVRRARPVLDRTFFWRYATQDAARSGKWKYLRDNQNEYLFDLSEDPGEKTDLKRKHAEVFAKLKAQFQRWESQMKPRPSYRS